MPFGKKSKSKSFWKRKGDYKRRGSQKDGKQTEPIQESSDEFFKTCLSSLETESSIEVQPPGPDNELKADEYYVILDRPYQYYEHDDLVTFVLSKKARVFSEFKEQTKSIESKGFICNRSSNLVRFVSLYDEDLVKLKVSVTVDKEFHVSIQVHDKWLPHCHEIWTDVPRVCYSVQVLEKIPNLVGSYSIRPGNNDPELQELVPVGAFIDSKELPVRQGYRDSYTGKSTILSSSCQLLITGTRCKSCMVYRRTLRVLLGRKEKQDTVKTPNKDWLHSRVPNNRLSENQKFYKLKQYKEYTQSLEKENSVLKKKIKREIDSKGVVLSEADNSDLNMQILERSKEFEHCDNYRGNENSYKQLFWEQQLQYNKLKDKRQMRWTPC